MSSNQEGDFDKTKKEVFRSFWLTVSAFAFLLVLIPMDEIFDLPCLIFGAPSTPINWMEIIMEVITCLIVAAIYLKLLYNDRIKRYRAEKELRHEHQYTLFLNDLMKHDISNMVQIILNYMELLQKMPDFPDKYKKAISVSFNQSKRIAKLISIVRKLSTSSISNSKELKNIDIYEIIMRIVPVIEKNFINKNINVKCDFSSGKVIVKGCELLEDVIDNLLINAVKYNNENNVAIEITHRLSDDKRMWEIGFKDNGPGVSDEMKRKIFDRLERGNNTVAGLGLGLTLVKKIVEESSKGKVWVEDKVQGDFTKGSNFIISLERGD